MLTNSRDIIRRLLQDGFEQVSVRGSHHKFAHRTKHLMGTSNNCPRLSGTPNLPTNDSALFSFRFCTVHPKDVRDCLPRQLFEVPLL
jgi:HicA toxin of bacterial toxin-antitoxin,